MSGHGKGERRGQERRSTPSDRRATHAPPPNGHERRASTDRRATDRRSAGQRLDVILDITRRLMSVTDLDALLLAMAQSTAELLAADRATIFVVDRDTNELWSRVALGAGEIRFPVGRGIAGSVAQTGEVVNKHGGGPFTHVDENTLASLGASAAVAVENAQLVAEQKRLWQSLIETLAATVDARDQQTAGHSQRVTRYAAVIGRSLGWLGKDLEKLQAAALLHDYGKIAVRDQFLQKPGKLDDAEFAYMKAHAEKTGEFLAHLVFPHDMREVPMIASQHHERMDGKGYPKGLGADKIHIGARIVAAADVFDALTAPRYYKPAYPLDKTLQIMDGMSGDHLDPRVMKAVHEALPELERTIEELKPTWPKPGDQGMGSINEAAGGLSERDRQAREAQP